MSYSSIWKKLFPHVLACLFLLVLSFVFFAPKFQGMQIRQGDVEKYVEMSQEVRDYYQKEGVGSSWTGSMFSGMPTYTITTQGGPRNMLDYLEWPLKALGGSDCGVLFFSMLSCYLLLTLLGVSIPLAILGAVAFSFSSYSIIILQAGHITKAWAMAYMPLIILGFIWILRQRYWLGGLVFALSLALQIKNNHPQITYYLTLFCCIVYVGYVIYSFKAKKTKPVYLSFTTLVVAIIVAFLCNMGPLYASFELSKESIRGKSELTHQVDGKKDKSSGLDKDYAFAWSYGKEETFTLLIPDFYGGASGGTLDKDSHLATELQRRGFQVPVPLQTYTYWGDQPFTSGPVYFGAIICLLFIFALLTIKHPLKWWIIGGMAVFILLSWGRNFDSFNTFMFHYLPFYNKFRTVSMALVIPQLIFVLVAVWGLANLFHHKISRPEALKALYYALGITGGLCLFFALFTPLSFHSVLDGQYQMPDWYMNALAADRADLLKSDAFRSLGFILIGGGCLWLYIRQDKPSRYLPYVLVIMVLLDLWFVDRRYLNETHFTKKTTVNRLYEPTPADRVILQDKDLSYRVLSLQDPFNNSAPSYYHKSIGGYNAAKLRRYQDLIEMRLSPEITHLQKKLSEISDETDLEQVFKDTKVLNMLNMRYLIINPSFAPLKNPDAMGNAWFVSQMEIVNNADEEMKRLQTIDPAHTALVDKRFASIVGEQKEWKLDSLAEITMTSYKPDRVEYRYHSSEPGLILFSEVYYPHGWKAEIDGVATEHFRANWILRGMIVPAGEHTISFYFHPDVYIAGRWIATITSSLLLLALLGFVVYYMRKRTSNQIKGEKVD